MQPWHLTSWQSRSIIQKVVYPSEAERDVVTQQLSSLPPLVTPLEVDTLKMQLATAAKGDAFLLQGGDCAESFADCHPDIILNKLRILLQINLVLLRGLKKPIIRVGRIAGQYAKPRSTAVEVINGQTLPTYRGDLINDVEFTKSARSPDPSRMLKGYQYSALTLNFIRSLLSGGFVNLCDSEHWNLNFTKRPLIEYQYHKIAETIHDTLAFMKAMGRVTDPMNRMDFYISHEALHLDYEQALTREIQSRRWYNLGTHFPWVGIRTADLNSAHIEYIRGISNPIAIKIGPSMTPQCLTNLVELLNPHNEPGKLTFIHRFGANQIAEKLPPLIAATKAMRANILWSCDPMHGNTTITAQGYKTRHFDIILAELEQAIKIHQENDSYLGAVHFELTGDEVTECIGGARGLTEDNLKEAYRTLVDPRLNYEQSLEMAMHLVRIKALFE